MAKCWTSKEHNRLLQLAPTGLGVTKIALRLKRSRGSIRGRIDKFKIAVSCTRPPHRIELPMKEVLRRFDAGHSTNSIAKHFGITYNTMAIRLLEHNRTPLPRKRHVVITETAREILDGLLLGDGCLSQSRRPGRAPALVVEQSIKRAGWLNSLTTELHDEGWSLRLKETAQKHGIIDGRLLHTGRTFRLYSRAYRELIAERARWYPGGTKSVPRDLRLTPRSTAHWFCGDGSYTKKGYLCFCTNGFTEDDVRWLIHRLLIDLNIEATLQHSSEGHPIIVVGKSAAAQRLAAAIRPFLPKCCLYKLKFVSG